MPLLDPQMAAKLGTLRQPNHTYIQVADASAARIAAGQYASRLPPERNIARELGVSYQTLRHGIGVLRERGVVVTRHGRGNFVTPRPSHRHRPRPHIDANEPEDAGGHDDQ